MTDLTITDEDETEVVVEKKAKTPVQYSYEVAEGILIAIAEGKTLTAIVKLPGMPARNTIYKWLTLYPKFSDAFERAKTVSAQSFEDEALTIARNLAGPNDYTGTKVSALNYAMQQLRWSAARRDPDRYGQRADATAAIPITINTTLNLGQDGQPPPTDEKKSIWTVEAVITPTEQPGYDGTEDEDQTIDLEAVTDDNGETVFGAAATDEKGSLHTPRKPGRPAGWKPGPRKNASRTKASATRNANKQSKKE